MYIKLRKKWQDYRRGSVLELDEAIAAELLANGIAIRVNPIRCLLSNGVKGLERPPMDKMMRKQKVKLK